MPAVPDNYRYWYPFKVDRVIDGDTIYGYADVGFGITIYLKVRLLNMNAPEIRGIQRPEGLISWDALKSMVENKSLIINTHKDLTGKYGRYLGVFYIDGDPVSINEKMVQGGFAE